VHAHWSPADFRQKTRLPKLADRILVVVDTDALPLPLRTGLFTADRTELLRNADAVRLESELIGFLDDWEELWRANNDLIRDAIRRSNADRSTAAVGRRIARALRTRSSVSPSDDWATRTPRKLPLRPDLLDEPTTLVAPSDVVALRGRTRGIYITINTHDRFIPRRAQLRVACTHPDIDATADITLGELRTGRLRVAVAVPPDAATGDFGISFDIPSWGARSGGTRPSLHATSIFRVVDPAPATGPPPIDDEAPPRPVATAQDRVALLWTTHESEAGWTPLTVGEIDLADAHTLAEADPEYADLRDCHFDVPVVRLNEEFTPLKAYAALRAREVGDEGVARAKDRYAVGVGVQLVLLDRYARQQAQRGSPVDAGWADAARAAAARGVLAVMPDYDQLVSEIGLEGL
jgi:hypothetical protein